MGVMESEVSATHLQREEGVAAASAVDHKGEGSEHDGQHTAAQHQNRVVGEEVAILAVAAVVAATTARTVVRGWGVKRSGCDGLEGGLVARRRGGVDRAGRRGGEGGPDEGLTTSCAFEKGRDFHHGTCKCVCVYVCLCVYVRIVHTSPSARRSARVTLMGDVSSPASANFRELTIRVAPCHVHVHYYCHAALWKINTGINTSRKASREHGEVPGHTILPGWGGQRRPPRGSA